MVRILSEEFANGKVDELPQIDLKKFISGIAIPKKAKEELVGYSNYQKLSKNYVERQR